MLYFLAPYHRVISKMPTSRNYKFLFGVVFSASLLLRTALVAINREANDPHWDVARRILQTNSLPTMRDCWECFQPKLYHYVFAETLKAFGLGTIPPYRQNLVGELINFFAGVITLAVVWWLIERLPGPGQNLKLLAFTLAALNPPLIGINSQATNDTFAILFSTLALYFTFDHFQRGRIRSFLLIVFFVILGISSKTNVWVTAAAIFIAFLIRIWVQAEERRKSVMLTLTFFFAVVGLSILNPFNQYIVNYREYGSPMVETISRQPLPDFFKQTAYANPGILSIQDGFFTFKFLDLIQHPRIDTTPVNFAAARTSFWTLLYGRAHSIHFDNWPPPWSTTGDTLFTLTRAILILALPPSILLMIGALIEGFLVFKSIIRRDRSLAQNTSFGLFTLVFVGYILFDAVFALFYRDYTTMKAIFTYPALLSFPVLFLRSTARVDSIKPAKWGRWITILLEGVVGVLAVLYVLDVVSLIAQLFQTYLKSRGL